MEDDARIARRDLLGGCVLRTEIVKEGGIAMVVIDSDAHSTKHLAFPRRYGVSQARRGWATANDVLNTRPLEQILGARRV